MLAPRSEKATNRSTLGPSPIFRLLLIAILTLVSAVAAAAQQDDPSKQVLAEPEGYAAVIIGNHIPLRDGTRLYATVYKPRDQKNPLPVIFTFTPYNTDTYNNRGEYFARHGYVFAIVDVRGRGNSGGTFDPFLREARDGADVVKWLAEQSWSNGKVAMWGGSYGGGDQWLTASQAPLHHDPVGIRRRTGSLCLRSA